MNTPTKPLPVLEVGGGCSCCSSGTTNTLTVAKEAGPNSQTFPVIGLTCAHCVGAVSAELKEIDGVSHVSVALVAGGTSTVTMASNRLIDERDVASALREAGAYQLATS
jgi:copper chaperone CopZ